MNVASPAQTPHLPAPPPGSSYRLRTVERQSYVTTGTFLDTAPDAKREHLTRTPTLILDCDLTDYVLATTPLNARTPELRAETKAALHLLPEPELTGLVNRLGEYANAQLMRLVGSPATITVSSGYGLHLYLWLPDSQGYGPEVETTRAINSGLVASFNSLCGFQCADPQCKDPGTRILRIPGTVNTKNPALPRPVRILYGAPWIRFDLTSPYFRSLASPASAASLPMPSLPTAAASADGESSPVAELFAKSETEAAEAVHLLMTSCPFFLWAQENPTKLGRESWRGAATNLAAVAGEYGRRSWHEFSALDPLRYDAATCDSVYTDSLRAVLSHGPMTYQTLANNGDWKGSGPAQVKSPAALKYLGKVAKLLTAKGSEVRIDGKTGYPIKSPGNLRKILRVDEKFGPRLRFNEMTGSPEVDGVPIEDAFYGEAGEYLEDQYKVSFARPIIADAVNEIARERGYSPVAEYLNGLVWDRIDRIPELTGILNAEAKPLYLQFLRAFLVGAVARALCTEPEGVKLDTALILKGDQGVRKSTFFNVLAGRYFNDSAMDLRSKDAYLTLQSAWIIEWAEFEYTLTRNQITAVKAFLASKVDTYRPPYGRETVTRPRRCIIVGTTNEDHFLFDPTGSRRFWVIEVKGEIDTTRLRAIRDQLWAQAVALYRAGAQWWLESDTDAERAALASQYQAEEPWEAVVTRFVESKRIADTSIDFVLLQAVQKEVKDWKGGDSQCIGRILRKLGFHRYRVMVEGKREYRYRRYLEGGTIDGQTPIPSQVVGAALRPDIVALFGEAK